MGVEQHCPACRPQAGVETPFRHPGQSPGKTAPFSEQKGRALNSPGLAQHKGFLRGGGETSQEMLRQREPVSTIGEGRGRKPRSSAGR